MIPSVGLMTDSHLTINQLIALNNILLTILFPTHSPTTSETATRAPLRRRRSTSSVHGVFFPNNRYDWTSPQSNSFHKNVKPKGHSSILNIPNKHNSIPNRHNNMHSNTNKHINISNHNNRSSLSDLLLSQSER